MIFFQGNRGRVIRVDDPSAQASIGFVDVQAPAQINFALQRSIITRITVAQEANVQFLHTLGPAVYIYVFGDRIGQLGLSGLSFNAGCQEALVGPDLGLGVERMLDWYRRYKVSEYGLPIRVMIGKTAIDAFLTSSNNDVVEPEMGLVQWSAVLRILPGKGLRTVLPPPNESPTAASSTADGDFSGGDFGGDGGDNRLGGFRLPGFNLPGFNLPSLPLNRPVGEFTGGVPPPPGDVGEFVIPAPASDLFAQSATDNNELLFATGG